MAHPDAILAAASYVSREYGVDGYSMEQLPSYSASVVKFTVRHFDGSEFVVAADRWGNAFDADACHIEREDGLSMLVAGRREAAS